MEKLLKIRKLLKRKKPKFTRQDNHKKAKLGNKWRKPKGSDSKMRRKLRGYKRSVTKGYKSPAAVRGLSADGKVFVKVESKSMLKDIKADTECIVISSSMGLRKKFEVVKAADQAGIIIANVKDPTKFITEVEKSLGMKKEKKTEEKKEKEKKEKEKEDAAKKKEEEKKTKEKASEQKTIEDIAEEEDKKKQEEKKEKDKILTKKGN